MIYRSTTDYDQSLDFEGVTKMMSEPQICWHEECSFDDLFHLSNTYSHRDGDPEEPKPQGPTFPGQLVTGSSPSHHGWPWVLRRNHPESWSVDGVPGFPTWITDLKPSHVILPQMIQSPVKTDGTNPVTYIGRWCRSRGHSCQSLAAQSWLSGHANLMQWCRLSDSRGEVRQGSSCRVTADFKNTEWITPESNIISSFP